MSETDERRQAVIDRLMLIVEHPFGGFDQPVGPEREELIEELLALPCDKKTPPGKRARWSERDRAACRVLATCGAELNRVAATLNRDPPTVFFYAVQQIKLTPPFAWRAQIRPVGSVPLAMAEAMRDGRRYVRRH